MTGGGREPYVPALRVRWLTPLYDTLVGLTTRERTFKGRLLSQADVRPGMRVLDLGCGTGTLAIWLKRRVPGATVVGLDGDPDVLAIARGKAARQGVEIELRQGVSYALPYPAGAFDRVLSSLFFHHLVPDQKRRTLAEVHRVLAPGGELHVADWGRPGGRMMHVLFWSIRLVDGFANTADHVAGRLPDYFRDAGFEAVELRSQLPTPYGTMALYSGRRP
jgi:ubiquinone/menaquinone biosynthesis C-methylase UbiE